MAISLDATLKTAQDGINHRPIVELTSSLIGSLIPITGNYFNSLTTDEYEPHIISLSSGALAAIMQRSNSLYYLYTPTDKSYWTEVAVTHPYATNASDPCICELADGNIGIIFVVNQTSLYYKIISPSGAIVTDYTMIESGIAWVANPYVLTLANDSYLLVYPQGTGTPPDTANTYYLKQRTSSNFTSWAGATDITPAAFSANNYCNNPNLSQVTSGRIFLHVDYLDDYVNNVELNNIYYMTSDDNGSSWSAAVQATSYSDIGMSATHPTAAESQTGDLTFIYAEKSLVKMLDTHMDGYPDTNFNPGYMNFDSDERELHVGCFPWSSGRNELSTIDIDTWELENYISADTIPAVEGGIAPLYKSDCEWDVWKISGHPQYIQSYNHDTEVSNVYVWGTAAGDNYGRAINYLVDMSCGYADINISHGIVVNDGGVKKLYLWAVCSGYGSSDAQLGYIDLDEVADPITGMYSFHEVMRGFPTVWIFPVVLGSCNVKEDKTHGYLMYYSSIDPYYAASDGLVVVDPSTGSIVIELTGNAGYPAYNEGMPISGLRDAVYIGDDIYMTFPYSASQPDRRGLACYHASSGIVTYYEPNWATVNEYNLDNLVDMGDGRILMTSNNTLANGGGVAIFDTNTSSWTIFNDDIYPGFGRPGASWGPVQYDSTTKTIFAIYGDTVIAFSEYGPYSLLKQSDISNVDTTVDYGSVVTFSYEFFEYQPNIAYDDSHVLWIVWQHLEDGSEYSAKWDNLIGDYDISNDLVSDIVIDWDVEKITQLSFSLAKGHLYDPQNLMSILSPFLQKGRKIAVRSGETVSSVEYWQNQGEYYVKSVALGYTTDEYPVAKITAEDLRTLWEDTEVVATQYYSGQSPYNVLEDILLSHADMESSEFDIPSTWENEHNLYHQFLDMNLDDIVNELLDHFGYFSFVNADAEFEPRYVDLEKAVDHAYSDNTKVIKYTPNDQFSTFINRVIVKGISHTYTEVMYEEEAITSISGTTGWWGKNQDETVWYSDDHNRTVRYPRLEVIQSVNDFRMFNALSGSGGESITSMDVDEHYCVITIEAPNLIPTLVACIAAAVATYGFCKGSCDGGPYKPGWCSWCNFAVVLELNLILSILSGVASYQYNVWGRPIGHEKKTLQAQADDEQFQNDFGGKIIPATIDDPMCYTVSSCQTVADHELAVIMAQRRRLQFAKTSHLQDEIGDVLSFVHPYSGETLKIFVAKLKRTWRINGECTDEIEGWRIMS